MRQQGCNARTHDAEAVAFESLFLSLFKRLLCGRDGVGFSVRDDQDDFPVLAEGTHLLHDPPERFRHRSHPVGDFGESGGELFTVPKDGHDRCPAFRRICAGKRRNAQIYARYALKSLSHGIAHGIRQHEPGIIHGTAAVQENVHRRIRRFPETVLHEHSGIPDRHPVAQRRGKTPSYSRHGGQPFLRLHESLKPETESGSLTFNPADLFGRKLRKPFLARDGYPQLFLPVSRSVQLNSFRQSLTESPRKFIGRQRTYRLC